MALTDKQRRFVEEYVGNAKFNGAEAARRAGYTGNVNTITSMASKLLSNEEIAQAVEKRMVRIASRCDVTAEKVINELALLGFSNMLDYLAAEDGDQPYIDLSKLTRDQAAALSEVTSKRYIEGRGEDGVPVVETKIKLSEKKGALELLGKHLGIFKESAPDFNVNLNVEPKIYLPDNGRD